MQEADRRRVPTSGAEPSGQEAVDTPVSALHRSQADEQGEKHSYGTKRKFIDIYDESRLGGFIDDASAMGNALDKVLDKSSSAETSKRTFIRQQVQQLNKELLGIAEVWYCIQCGYLPDQSACFCALLLLISRINGSNEVVQATYLDMLYKILTQTPEILDAVFQTDRGNKILESLAEKVHKYGHSICAILSVVLLPVLHIYPRESLHMWPH